MFRLQAFDRLKKWSYFSSIILKRVLMDSIKEIVKNYLLEEFVNESETGPVTDSLPLLSSGILDSISAQHLYEIMEKPYE